MNSTPPTFTAAQIGRASGKSKRAVWRSLGGVPSTTRVRVGGNEAEAWTVPALPLSLQAQLNTEAKRRGYRDAEHLLSTPPQSWQPTDANGRPLSLADIAQRCLDRAVKLQRALAPSLARMNDLSLSEAEFEQRGVEDYADVFGHIVTARHWRDLFKRTVERDAGAENWDRLAIYVEERPARKLDAAPVFSAASGEEFRELPELLAGFRDPAAPSTSEKGLLWLRAFELFEAQIADGKAPKKLKRRLLAFLWQHAPQLTKSPNALRVNFERCLKGGREHGVAWFFDGRNQNKGVARAEPIAQESVDRITWHAVANCGGRVAQAVRELIDLEALDPALQEWFAKRFASKSYVPHRLRNAVQDQVRALMPHHQGPRAAEKTIPPLDLNYDGISSMQCVCVDDFTWPVKLRVPDGKGWWRITRGQCILVIDFRSLCVLSFGLQEEEQPNSLIARTALVRAFREHGLPALLYIERGKVFADSKLITGGARARRQKGLEDAACSDAEVEMGLRQFGIEIIVARRARSKPVERVGGLLQDLMHGEPAYSGREERHDCPEETIHWEKELARGNPKALEHFYTMDQWEARLWELCERYNGTPHGARAKRNPGISPVQQFRQLWPRDDPPTKLSPEVEFLLAHHRIENVEIKDTGIWLENRSQSFRYFDDQTGDRRLKDRSVIAWFNPEAPERCTFTDSKMRNAFTVERHKTGRGSALSFDKTTEAESAKAHAHTAAAGRRYRALKAQPWATFRNSVVLTPKTVELGREIEDAREAAVTKEREEQSLQNKLRSRAKKLGLPAAFVRHGDTYEDEGTRLMMEAEREHNATPKQGDAL